MRHDRRALQKALKERQGILRERLQDTLEFKGWSQTVLSKRSGVATSTLYNFMGGRRDIGMAVFRSLAEALDISEEYLLGLTTDPARIEGIEKRESSDTEERPKSQARRALEALLARLSPEEQEEAIAVLDAFTEAKLRKKQEAAGQASPKKF